MRFPWFRARKKTLPVAAVIISVVAAIGMTDAFYLLLEYIQVLLHPGEPTPCTVSTLVSCTLTVQGTYAHFVPGIPNPMFGMLWYAGFFAYGMTRLLGSEHARRARAFVALILIAGLIFSYRLYLASIFDLGGVCPFCLASTTASTLIALAFVVDDQRYSARLVRGPWLMVFRLFQIFSTVVFVLGLPVFISMGLRWLPDPMTAVTHWSFPVMIALVVIMAWAQVWAFLRTSRA